MRKTTLIIVGTCGFATWFLWREFSPKPVDTVASVPAEITGPPKYTRPAENATVARTRVAAPKPVAVARTPPADVHTEQETEEEIEAEQLIELERSSTDQYPSEQDVSFRLRMRVLRLFDEFVEKASLSDEEIAALQVAIYDAQSAFGEVQRRPYVYVDRKRPPSPNWIDEARSDAAMLRREFLRAVIDIVGKDRARLLDHTVVTTLDTLPFRVFLKPDQTPIALIAEQPF
jgi:hypothetical protein